MAPRWTQEERLYVIDNYNLIGIKEIAQYLGRSVQTVYTFCSNNNLTRKFVWTPEEEFILLSNPGLTARQLTGLVNRTQVAIKLRRHELGMKFEGRGNRFYSVNHHYFSNINQETCYWAGFTAADGNVGNKQKVLRISLNVKDEQHLYKLRECLQYTGPIRHFKVTAFGQTSNMAILQVSSVKIVADLYSNFNIIPNKTFSLLPPTHIREKELLLAFIIGMIDGDGTILKSNGYLHISITGNFEMLTFIKNFFDLYYSHTKRKPSKLIKRKTVFQYTISGSRALKMIEDAQRSGLPILERKWDR